LLNIKIFLNQKFYYKTGYKMNTLDIIAPQIINIAGVRLIDVPGFLEFSQSNFSDRNSNNDDDED